MSHRFSAIASLVCTFIVFSHAPVGAQTESPIPKLVALRTQATELKKGDQRKRLDVLKELIKQEPNDPMWQVQLGDTYYALGWYDDGVDAYVEFAKRFPTHPLYEDVCFAVANCLKQAGRAREAEKYLLTLPKDDPEWIIRVGVWRAELARNDLKPETGDPVFTARAMLTDLIAKYPAEPPIWEARNSLAFTFLLSAPQYSNPARAREEFQAMIRDYPGHQWTNGWKGLIAGTYDREKDYDAALRQWRSIVEDPSAVDHHAAALCRMADYYTRIGQQQEAERLWKTVLDLYPDDPNAASAKRSLGIDPGRPEWEPVEVPINTTTLSEGAKGLRYSFSGPSLWPLVGEFTKIDLQYEGKPLLNSGVIATLTRMKPSTKPGSSLEETDDRKEISFRWTGGGNYFADLNSLGPGKYVVRLCITPAGQTDELKPSGICWVISAAKCPRIGLAELKRLSDLKSVVLVDVRDHPEVYIQGALLIPAPKLAEFKDTRPAGKTIALYGSSYWDHVEANAVRALAKLGVPTVAVLGGFDALKAAGWATATD